MRTFATLNVPEEVIEENADRRVVNRYTPLGEEETLAFDIHSSHRSSEHANSPCNPGVVVAIVPWNCEFEFITRAEA